MQIVDILNFKTANIYIKEDKLFKISIFYKSLS